MGPRRAYSPPLERLEAGLELVREGGRECGLALGQDFSVVIDIGADRLYDQVCVCHVRVPLFGSICERRARCSVNEYSFHS